MRKTLEKTKHTHARLRLPLIAACAFLRLGAAWQKWETDFAAAAGHDTGAPRDAPYRPQRDPSEEFSAAATWLLSTFHSSQVGIVLVFASDRSVRLLPSWALPCGKRHVSPIDRVCFYVVEAGDLEQGLAGFDLLTDGLHSSYIAAVVVWELEPLSVAGIDWDELVGALPSFARILLSDTAKRALPQLATPQLPMVGQSADSALGVVYNVGRMLQGPHVEMRLEPAARPLSSADFVRGVCEAHLDEGEVGNSEAIDSLIICVAVWGYMSQFQTLLQCGQAGARLLSFSHTLPYGMVSLGCMLIDAELFSSESGQVGPPFGHVTSPPEVADKIETWFPGFGLPPGSNATVTVILGLSPLDRASLRVGEVRQRASIAGNRVDGMVLSVDGSSVEAARRWSGFSDTSGWNRKVATQKQILASLLPTTEAIFRVLEVGCGGLTIGAWLIDSLSPFSYVCVDVAPWAAAVIIDAGPHIDVDSDLSSFTQRDLRSKHPQIEGNAECKVRASDRGTFNVVFSFTMFGYLSCPMLLTCLDSMAQALNPTGTILVAVPSPQLAQGAENSAATLVGNARKRQFVLGYPSLASCDVMDGTRQWARSNGFVVTVVDASSMWPQELWQLSRSRDETVTAVNA